MVTRFVFAAYAIVTIAAIFFTITRVALPDPVHRVVRLSYKTLAPFVGYRTESQEFRVQAKIAGEWNDVDLRSSLPFRRLTRTYRLHLVPVESDATKEILYRKLLDDLKRLEEGKRGESIEGMRLLSDRWPSSPYGFEARRTPTETVTTTYVTMP